MSKTIRIGGVPEHYNTPIHLAIESGAIDNEGLKVEWKTFEGGTGEMREALINNEVDICAILTEGIVSGILQGVPAKIISGYVKSPLIWGIHSGTENPIKDHKEIYDKQFAISRIGSGSHLMPIVDALNNDKKIEESQFHIINNLKGALSSLEKQETDVFYWEKYTTKPYVERGELKRIGEYVTPWPCFVLAAHNDIINERPKDISRVLRQIQRTSAQFMENEDAVEIVSKRFEIKKEDAAKWYHATEWATDGWVSNKMLKNVVYTLKAANIINEMADTQQLVWQRNSI
ncbi:substrate-binding domain-containing protein [Marivirga tractuosa]|uniref:substrate-binding domain-containing protein n=1 Tax=Marivirga tractuosa TaxID=1006 RepID=UPI0035D049BA